MYLFKFFVIFFVSLSNVSCKSFTLVIDTTLSMLEEIDNIKTHITSITRMDLSDFSDFILVPFKDPDVGPPYISNSSSDLIQALYDLSESGGNECPENSLAGIKKALEFSKSESHIFVFTDAYAQTFSKNDEIKNLCREKHSQVTVFLTGYCRVENTTQAENIKLYYDVLQSCLGIVFQIEPTELRQAFRYIREITKMEWNDVSTQEYITGYKELTISVNSFTTGVTVVVSGDDYTTLMIEDIQGESPIVEKVFDSIHSLVIRVIQPNIGDYKLSVRCQGATVVTVYKKQDFPFQYGFSTHLPNSIQETSNKPLPGNLNYILVVVPYTYNIKVNKIEIQILDLNDRNVLMAEEIKKGSYIAKIFIEPDKDFRVILKGQDASNFEDFSSSTRILHPQKFATESLQVEPKSEIITLEEIIVDANKNITMACKVTAFPEPDIWWETDKGEMLPSQKVLLEIPSVYISYITVEMKNNVTLYCKSRNSIGEQSQNIDLFVKQNYFFEVIQTPKDKIVEYGGEEKLFCEVSAFPEATIIWYHNDSAVEYDNNLELLPDEKALVIKNMTLDNVGDYKCEISNAVESKAFSAFVSISGLEFPKIEVSQSETALKPGEWAEIGCSVIEGKPIPVINWKYKPDDTYDYGDLPEGVEVDRENLKIANANAKHDGYYRCEVENVLGHDSKEIRIKIQYSPIIKNIETTTILVTEGDPVELTCEVDAIPKAIVKWEMTRDDVIVPFDERHSTDYKNTHRFNALSEDSGNYHCLAENVVGQDKKTVTLNVLVMPYIQPPPLKSLTAGVGENINFNCNVTHGNPAPLTKWKFIAPDSTTTVLTRGNSSNTVLRLVNVSKANEGTYLCIAQNNIGSDNIKIYLKVQ